MIFLSRLVPGPVARCSPGRSRGGGTPREKWGDPPGEVGGRPSGGMRGPAGGSPSVASLGAPVSGFRRNLCCRLLRPGRFPRPAHSPNPGFRNQRSPCVSRRRRGRRWPVPWAAPSPRTAASQLVRWVTRSAGLPVSRPASCHVSATQPGAGLTDLCDLVCPGTALREAHLKKSPTDFNPGGGILLRILDFPVPFLRQVYSLKVLF